MATDVNRPNGITLSPDGKTLYVNDWDSPNLVAYAVQPDGSLKNRRNFGKFDVKQETDHGLVSGADGLSIDSAGPHFPTPPRRLPGALADDPLDAGRQLAVLHNLYPVPHPRDSPVRSGRATLLRATDIGQGLARSRSLG